MDKIICVDVKCFSLPTFALVRFGSCVYIFLFWPGVMSNIDILNPVRHPWHSMALHGIDVVTLQVFVSSTQSLAIRVRCGLLLGL